MNQNEKKRCDTRKSTLVQVLVLLLVGIAVVPLVFAGYEENVAEGIYLVRPENSYLAERVIPTYLSSEDLTFFACIEADNTPVRLSVLCEDDNNFIDVTAVAWGTENCYIGSVDLDDFACYSAVIAADYVEDGENLRLTKQVRINKVTGALQRMLDTQYSDGGWSSSLDTAFALYSLKPFESVFTDVVEKGLLYLKESRNEIEKCWPEQQCQVSTTAMISYLISQAGYEDTLRIVHDSTVYLERYMSYIESGEEWTVTIEDFITNQNNSANTSCVFGYGTDSSIFNISRYGTETNLTLTPDYDEVINVVCTENVYADIISSERGKLIHYEGDNLTYTIPGPCWTYNNENVSCDIRATALALGTPLAEERRDAARTWLAEQLETDVLGMHFSDEDIMNLALTAVVSGDELDTDERELVLRNLLYAQTNKGGWNTTSPFYNTTFYEPQRTEVSNRSHVFEDNYSLSIVYTGFALQALLGEGYTADDEPVIDAQRWVSVNEESVTAQLDDESATDAEIVELYDANVTDIIQDPKRNAMALSVLQSHTRPFIKSNPQVIVLSQSNMTIDLVNPTTFSLTDITYDLDDDLDPYISIEEKDYLQPYSFRRVRLTQTTSNGVDAFGYLRVLADGEEYAKIPVVLTSAPRLSIAFPTSVIAFGSAIVVPLNISKSSHNFSCTLKWSDSGITAPSTLAIELSGTYNLPLTFTQAGTEEKDYAGVLTCVTGGNTLAFPFTLPVTRFLTKPFSVTPSALALEGEETIGSFEITNLLDESIDVTVTLREQEPRIDISDQFINMYPGETRNVTLTVLLPAGENVSIVNSVIVRSFNVEERIPLQVELIYQPPIQRPLWLTVSVLVFVVGMLGLIGYFAYDNRKKLLAWYVKKFQKENTYKKVLAGVEDYEQREEAIAIKNMVEILKMEGASDKDIRTRLSEAGFSEAEITAALKYKEEAKPMTGAANQVQPRQK